MQTRAISCQKDTLPVFRHSSNSHRKSYNLFVEMSALETGTHLSSRCVILPHQPLEYIVDKPKCQWQSYKDNNNDTIILDKLVLHNAEHVGETVWVENVQLKLLCTNFKKHKYRHFRVYQLAGGPILNCFHVREWFQKQHAGAIFAYDEASPLQELISKWNDILQHLRFNIQLRISNRTDHHLLQLDPISMPIYRRLITQVDSPLKGCKWRVPNPNLCSNEIALIKVEQIRETRVSMLSALSFDGMYKIRLFGLSQPRIMCVGPVSIKLQSIITMKKCKDCLERCSMLYCGDNSHRARLWVIEFLVKNPRCGEETARMHGYVGQMEMLALKKVKTRLDGMEVYLRVQHNNNYGCVAHESTLDDNNYQIVELWYLAPKVVRFSDRGPFIWHGDVTNDEQCRIVGL